ncbi:unnamed protein product [Caenorhabditis angaria]|uniref:Uncharacterized protein n=1 Tax=Caenorhabditis angaria TaxID=860376 RepID=A0A9P1J0C6_9PELO|nr:unnamed protein product [Caenorhabditis angaria]
MSIARACYVSIMPLFQTILSFIRSLCGGNRANKRVDMNEIPFEVVVDNFGAHKGEERASLLQNADSWDDADWDKKEEVNDKIEQWRQTNQPKADHSAPAEDDLFSTLEPTITSARKVVLKPKGFQQSAQQQKRSLFEFNEESMVSKYFY